MSSFCASYPHDPKATCCCCCRTGFADLPQDCLLNIMNRLGPRALADLAGSCRALRVLSRQAVPGLQLTLYPHQVCWCMWHFAEGSSAWGSWTSRHAGIGAGLPSAGQGQWYWPSADGPLWRMTVSSNLCPGPMQQPGNRWCSKAMRSGQFVTVVAHG